MGYACPVCETPQADAGHLANHLAFTAITGGDDHEQWLDEHVPEWDQLGESELGDELIAIAEETDFPFEEGGHDHGHGGGQHGDGHHDHQHGIDTQQARARGSGQLDDDAAAILSEARELTESMREQGDSDDGDTGDSDDGTDAATTDESADADETE